MFDLSCFRQIDRLLYDRIMSSRHTLVDGRAFGVRIVVFNEVAREKYSIKAPDGLRFAVNDRPVTATDYDPVMFDVSY